MLNRFDCERVTLQRERWPEGMAQQMLEPIAVALVDVRARLQRDHHRPLEEAVNTLTAQYGTQFVVAAGNEGPGASTVGSPGSADAALTVGAVNQADQLASFSSRGPRVGDWAVKPDITAPGADIVAARSAGTALGEPIGDSYARMSGTSMATPLVAGSFALVQQHPQWSPEQYKATLMASARPAPDQTAVEQGAGRLDVVRAMGNTVR